MVERQDVLVRKIKYAFSRPYYAMKVVIDKFTKNFNRSINVSSFFELFSLEINTVPHNTRVLVLEGSLEHCAHTWSKSGILISERHLITSTESQI